MKVVPRVNTPVSASDAKSKVETAYRTILGRDPEPTLELPLLMSLVWIETARGKSVQNNNLGNITASENYQGEAWRPPWFDLEGGTAATERNIKLHDLMLKGQAPSAFRAYTILIDGAEDFIRQLERNFPEVLEAAAEGDPTGFRDALAQHYSHDYKNTPPGNFESLAKEFGFEPRVSVPRGNMTRVLALAGFAGILAYGAKTLFADSATTRRGLRGSNGK